MIATSKGKIPRCTSCVEENGPADPNVSVWICLTCALLACGTPSVATTHIGRHLWRCKSTHKLVVKLADYSQGLIIWCSECLSMVNERCFVTNKMPAVRTLFHRIKNTFQDLKTITGLNETNDNSFQSYKAESSAALSSELSPQNHPKRTASHSQLTPSRLGTNAIRLSQPTTEPLPTATEGATTLPGLSTETARLDNKEESAQEVGPILLAIPTCATETTVTTTAVEPPDGSTPASHTEPTKGPVKVTTPPQVSTLDNNNSSTPTSSTRDGTNQPITPAKTGPKDVPIVMNFPAVMKRNTPPAKKKRLKQINEQSSSPRRLPSVSASPRRLRPRAQAKSKLDSPVSRSKLASIDSLLARRITLTPVVVEPRTDAENVRGLINLGSTCFLNATLQCLACCDELLSRLLSPQRYVLQGSPQLKLPELPVLAALREDKRNVRWVLSVLLQELRQRGAARKPQDLINVLKLYTNNKFDFNKHQDAQEIFDIICDALDSDVRKCLKGEVRVRGNRRVHYLQQISWLQSSCTQLYTGQLERVICSASLTSKSSYLEPFVTWHLDLVAPRDVPRTTLVPSSWKINQQNNNSRASSSTSECDVFKDDDQVTIESCLEASMAPTEEIQDMTSKVTHYLVDEPPAHLVLCLKRYKHTMGSKSWEKLTTPVTFKPVLDLTPFCNEKAAKSSKKYSLYGVVSHSGSLSYGHYIAYIKVERAVGDKSNNESTQDPEDVWFKCDDSRAKRTKTDDVFSAEPYMLFYKLLEE